MHFSIRTAALKQAIDTASHASVVTNVTPILENILLSARFKKVFVTANNLEMAIECSVDTGVDVKTEGDFTVSSRFIASYVSLVQDETIEIKAVEGEALEISTATSHTRIKGTDASKFPVLPNVRPENPFSLSAKILKQAFEKTMFSTADGNIRPTLAGVLLSIEKTRVIFASTDSFRLSELILERKAKAKDERPSVIIPKKTVTELGRIFDEESTVEMYAHESQALFVAGGVRVFSRLLNGHFPDYGNFFPKSYATKWVIRRQDLVNGLKRANLIARENNFNTRLRFDADTGLEVSTGDTEIGAGTLQIPASVEGENAAIGINSTYLLEVLSVMREDYVSIDFETPLSPVLIKDVPEKTGEATYRHIIMPLKI